jgi:protein-S-isoprenylcysteine O-methyltransferase Ste14
MTAAHAHPWKISDVVLFPLLGLALVLEWLWPTSIPVTRAVGLAVGLAVFVFGFWLISRSKKELDVAGQPSLPGEPTTDLVVTGPFAWSRNPNYLGALLAGLGGALAIDTFWVLGATLVAAAILDVWMIRPEERYLAGLFGDRYASYRKRVRRWI